MSISNFDSDLLIGATATVTTTSLALGLDSYLRQGETVLENLTTTKVLRTGLYTIASLLPWLVAKTARESGAVLFSLLGSAVCIYVASKTRDYDDRKELAIMKIAAQHMSFDELKNTHGLNRIVKYDMVTNLSEKFIYAYDGQTFSKMVSDHPLEEIARYGLCPLTPNGFVHQKFAHELAARKLAFIGSWNSKNTLYTKILSPEMYSALVWVQQELTKIDQTLKTTLSDLDITYSERTEIQLQKFATRERNIPAQARQFGEAVASSASGSAVNTAVVNALWDGNTKHVFRDTGTGFNVAEAAGQAAEQAELDRLRKELARDRADPNNIARGAQQQRFYEEGVVYAQQVREASMLSLESELSRALGNYS